MATSGSVNTSKYDGRYASLSWSCTQSGNTLTVSWTCSLAGGASSWYITSQCFFDITYSGCSGPAKVTVLSYNTSRKGYKGQIGSGSFTVTVSGSSPTMSIKLSVATYQYAVNCTGSNSWSLPAGGSVRIYTSSGWKNAVPYVYTSSGWKVAQPYVYTSSGWKLAT